MIQTGRNDPCPCGSGKKYKKCCLVSAQDAEFQYRRFRQTHSGLIPRLTQFAFEVLSPELVEEAWLDFNDHQTTEPFDPNSPMNVLFMPWFFFNWIVELKRPGQKALVETTIAEMFLVNDLEYLTSDEQMLLRTSIRAPYTLCEVVEVIPGRGMVLLDLLRQTTYEVTERTASESLKRGEIIYCATSEVWGIKSNVGTGPFALRPTAKRDVFDLRKWIIEQSGSGKITTEHLHEFEYDIRGLYLHLLAGMFAPPQLANTDGHLMVPQKLYFQLESTDQAFHALKTLAKGRNETALMGRATVKDGSVVRAEIEWLGGTAEAKKRLGGPVLLGLLKIDNERLIVEVNSNERAGRIRKLIEKRLGSGVKYKTTLIEPIESQVREMWQSVLTGDSASQQDRGFGFGGGSISIGDEPEVRVMLEEAARQHWESWFDLPVPALADMTPRQAAKTAEGRELLNSLLLFYEHSADRSPDKTFQPDLAALRRELGID